ncbi:MAG: hypothetical protein P1U63_10430 [Coxiellaceae bacterium]|nr:hypothetical protein [Coxiellaceae bacterium]
MSRARVVARTHKIYFDLEALVVDTSKPAAAWQSTQCAQILSAVLPAKIGELQETFGSAVARDMELVIVARNAWAEPSKLRELLVGLKGVLSSVETASCFESAFTDAMPTMPSGVSDDVLDIIIAGEAGAGSGAIADVSAGASLSATLVDGPSLSVCPFTVLLYETSVAGKVIWTDCQTFSAEASGVAMDLSASMSSGISTTSSMTIASPISVEGSELKVDCDNSLVFTGDRAVFSAFNCKGATGLRRVCVRDGEFDDASFRSVDAIKSFVGDFQYTATKRANQQNAGRRGLAALAGLFGGRSPKTPSAVPLAEVTGARVLLHGN